MTLTHPDSISVSDGRSGYIAYAKLCLALASSNLDHQERVLLREMAAEWLRLAERPSTEGTTGL